MIFFNFLIFGLSAFGQYIEPALVMPIGHSDYINTCVFSPSDNFILTSSNDNSAMIWDSKSGKLLKTLDRHSSAVTSAKYSPDGKRIMTLSKDTSIAIWEGDTGKFLFSLKGHNGHIYKAEFSPKSSYDKFGGKYILTCSDDSTAVIWNSYLGNKEHTIKDNESYISYVQFSPDGNFILTRNGNNVIKVRKMFSWELILSINESESVSCQFSPDSRQIMIKKEDENSFYMLGRNEVSDSTVTIWNLEDSRKQFKLNHSSSITSAEFSTSNKYNTLVHNYILTSGDDGIIKLWHSRTGQLIRSYYGHRGGVKNSIFSPDCNFILSYGQDDSLKLWETHTGKIVYSLNENDKQIEHIDFLPDGKNIFVALRTNILSHYKGTDTKMEGEYRILKTISGTINCKIDNFNPTLHSFEFCADGDQLIINNGDKKVSVYNTKTGKNIFSLEGYSKEINVANFFPANSIFEHKNILIVSKDDGTILDFETGKIISKFKVNLEKYCNLPLISPKGNYILSSISDDSLSIINKESLTLNQYKLLKSCYSPNDEYLLTYGEENILKVFDLKTGKLVFTFVGHEDEIYTAIFSPKTKDDPKGGKYLATGSRDSTIIIWDFTTGKIFNIIHNYDYFSIIRFSLDGNYLVTIPFSYSLYFDDKRHNHIAKFWDYKTGKLIKTFPGYCDSYELPTILSLNSKYLLTTTNKDSLNIWDIETGLKLFSVECRISNVNKSTFCCNSKNLIIQTYDDNPIRIFDLEQKKEISSLNINDEILFKDISLELSPNEKYLLIMHEDDKTYRIGIWDEGEDFKFNESNKRFKLWENENFNLINSFEDHRGEINSVSFSPDDRYIISCGNDTKMCIYDTQIQSNIYTRLQLTNNDWLIYDKYHRFDGTINAINKLYFTCGTEIIDLDQLKDELYVPNLVERIMRGDTIYNKKLSDLDICELMPKVEEIEDGNTNYIKYKIMPRKGGLGKTEIYINDKGVVQTLQPQDLRKNGDNFELWISKKEYQDQNFFLPGEENIITIKSFTKENNISSRGSIRIEQDTRRKLPPPNVYAIFIGVNEYKGNGLDLKYASKDAQTLSTTFTSSSNKFFNTKTNVNNVYTYNLCDLACEAGLPEKKKIEKVIQEVGAKSKPNDIVFIFFAGHGQAGKGDDKSFYFLTSDASPTLAESNLSSVSISSTELKQWVAAERMKAQKLVLVFDACQAAQMISAFNDKDYAFRNETNEEEKKILEFERMNDKAGMYLLTSSAPDQSSYELDKYGHGLLTYSMLKTIKENTNITDQNGYLSINKWFDESIKTLEDIARKDNIQQRPDKRTGSDFTIGIVDDEVRKSVNLGKGKIIIGRSFFNDPSFTELFEKTLSAKTENSQFLFNKNRDDNNSYRFGGTYQEINGLHHCDMKLYYEGKVAYSLKLDDNDMKKLVERLLEEGIKFMLIE
ncbi:MAG TPA: caspase family protein [Saprospiraceae bacterium]|nr:caspase family protein [Saprospiraceae bacterium]